MGYLESISRTVCTLLVGIIIPISATEQDSLTDQQLLMLYEELGIPFDQTVTDSTEEQ